jgi:hypothetical protein
MMSACLGPTQFSHDGRRTSRQPTTRPGCCDCAQWCLRASGEGVAGGLHRAGTCKLLGAFRVKGPSSRTPRGRRDHRAFRRLAKKAFTDQRGPPSNPHRQFGHRLPGWRGTPYTRNPLPVGIQNHTGQTRRRGWLHGMVPSWTRRVRARPTVSPDIATRNRTHRICIPNHRVVASQRSESHDRPGAQVQHLLRAGTEDGG